MAVRPDAKSSFNGNVSGAAFSWTHTAAAGAYVIVDVISDRVQMPSSGITYGGVAMTRTAISPVMTVNAGSGYLCRYELAGVAGGAQTVQFPAVTGAIWTVGTAVSYTGVTSANTPTVSAIFNSGIGVEPSIGPITVSSGNMAVSTIGASTTAGSAVSPSLIKGGNNRLVINAGFAVSLIASDSYTTATFSAAYVSSGTLSCGITTILNGAAPSGNTVTRDAVAAGNHALASSGSTGTTVSWSHTFGATPTGIVVFVDGYNSTHSQAAYTRSVTVGGVALTLLGVMDLAPNDTWVEMWGLIGSSVAAWANTTQTVIVNEFLTANGATFYPSVHGTSASYNNAGSFGPAQTFQGSSSTPSIAVPTDQYHMTAACMGSSAFTDQAGNGNQIYNFTYTVNGNQAMYAEDLQGTPSSVTLSSVSQAGNAAAIGVDIIPPQIDTLTGTTITATPGTVDNIAPQVDTLTGDTITATPGTVDNIAPQVDTLTGDTITATPGTVDNIAPQVDTLTGDTITTTPGTVDNTAAQVDTLSGDTITATPRTVDNIAPQVDTLTGPTVVATPGTVDNIAPQVDTLTGPTVVATPGTVDNIAPQVGTLSGPTVTATPGAVDNIAPQVDTLSGDTITTTLGSVNPGDHILGGDIIVAEAGQVNAIITDAPVTQGVTISKSASPGVILASEDNGYIVLSPRRIS